jgi:hypothetical protein
MEPVRPAARRYYQVEATLEAPARSSLDRHAVAGTVTIDVRKTGATGATSGSFGRRRGRDEQDQR